MKTCCPAGSGSATKRGSDLAGMWITESALCGSAEGVDGRMETTRQSERFPRYGKGWPGSTASGVRTGSSVRRKYSSRKRSCSSLTPWGGADGSLGGEQRLAARRGSSGAARPPARWTRAATAASVSAGVRPSGPAVWSPGPDAALQRRHADHEELVQVRAEDGEELHALEQRHARILRLLEHAPVELEPGQLAVDERVGVHPIAAR